MRADVQREGGDTEDAPASRVCTPPRGRAPTRMSFPRMPSRARRDGSAAHRPVGRLAPGARPSSAHAGRGLGRRGRRLRLRRANVGRGRRRDARRRAHVDLRRCRNAWGTGAGRLLMSAFVERLRESGFEDATLWVLDDNPRARRFYEAAGWTLDGGSRTTCYSRRQSASSDIGSSSADTASADEATQRRGAPPGRGRRSPKGGARGSRRRDPRPRRRRRHRSGSR